MDTHVQKLLTEAVNAQKLLLVQTGHLIDRQTEEIGKLQRQMEQLVEASQRSAQRLENGGKRFADDAVTTFGQRAKEVLTRALDGATSGLHSQLRTSCEQLRQATDAAASEANRLSRVQKTMAWKATAVLLTGATTVVVGLSFWVHGKKIEAERYLVQVEWASALADSDLVACGEQRVCVRLDDTVKRDKTSPYRVVARKHP